MPDGSLATGVVQTIFIDDLIQKAELRLRNIYAQLKISPEDIVYRQFDHYIKINEDGETEAMVFIVIEYIRRNTPTE
ncbi:hypothetical protein ACFL29_00610 [Patescibacteria group bacterium]